MRTRSRLATTIAVALSGAALAGPAMAVPGPEPRSPDAISAGSAAAADPSPDSAQDRRSPDAVSAATASPSPATTAPAPVTRTLIEQPSSGFDWGSAAIGAGGMIGLVAVGLGSGLVLRRRHATAPTSLITH
jgi:hypothetical protein